jgi:hypothetical protein
VQRRAVGGRKENRPSELKEEEEEEEEGEIEKEKRAEIVLIAGARESETGSQSSRPLSLPVGRSDGRRCSCWEDAKREKERERERERGHACRESKQVLFFFMASNNSQWLTRHAAAVKRCSAHVKWFFPSTYVFGVIWTCFVVKSAKWLSIYVHHRWLGGGKLADFLPFPCTGSRFLG